MTRSPALRLIGSAALVVALLRVQPDASAQGGEGAAPTVRDLLGAMDFVPLRDSFDDLLGPQVVEGLATIAADTSEDPGVRLRAIRALSHYPSEGARAALYSLIDALRNERDGTGVLHLRAALEALGEIGGPDAVPEIIPFLSAEDSLDLRATAANALKAIRSPTAAPALRARQREETSPQVLFAITEALRAILGGGGQ